MLGRDQSDQLREGRGGIEHEPNTSVDGDLVTDMGEQRVPLIEPVPANHFVDPLMKHLGHPYYVGSLSAAEMHDAEHSSVNSLQITPRKFVNNLSSTTFRHAQRRPLLETRAATAYPRPSRCGSGRCQ